MARQELLWMDWAPAGTVLRGGTAIRVRGADLRTLQKDAVAARVRERGHTAWRGQGRGAWADHVGETVILAVSVVAGRGACGAAAGC
jgi:hypothetical protein